MKPVAMGTYRTYVLRIGNRRISWSQVEPLLREALELDRSPKERTAEARYLAEFLHAEKPTLVQYILARPKLKALWHALLQQE